MRSVPRSYTYLILCSSRYFSLTPFSCSLIHWIYSLLYLSRATVWYIGLFPTRYTLGCCCHCCCCCRCRLCYCCCTLVMMLSSRLVICMHLLETTFNMQTQQCFVISSLFFSTFLPTDLFDNHNYCVLRNNYNYVRLTCQRFIACVSVFKCSTFASFALIQSRSVSFKFVCCFVFVWKRIYFLEAQSSIWISVIHIFCRCQFNISNYFNFKWKSWISLSRLYSIFGQYVKIKVVFCLSKVRHFNV